MRKFIYTIITIGLTISFTSCSSKEISTLSSQSQPSNKIITSNAPKQVTSNSDTVNIPPANNQEQRMDKTVTYPLHFVSYENNVENNKIASDINLIIIDSNGKTVGKIKTGKDGAADITMTVPIDKRYNSQTGTVTVIGYNNDKYMRTVMLEVPVSAVPANQNISMIPKTGYRDEEVNICYGNIHHLLSMEMVDKYIPWKSGN